MNRSISHIAVVTSYGGGACPEQHWGHLITGEEFYLRYRHGDASLHVGPEDCDWPNLPDYGWGLCRAGIEVSPEDDGSFASERQRLEAFETLLSQLRPGWLVRGAHLRGQTPIMTTNVVVERAQT